MSPTEQEREQSFREAAEKIAIDNKAKLFGIEMPVNEWVIDAMIEFNNQYHQPDNKDELDQAYKRGYHDANENMLTDNKAVYLEGLQKDVTKLYNSKCYVNPNNAIRDILDLIEYYKSFQSPQKALSEEEINKEYSKTEVAIMLQDCAIHFGITDKPKDDGTILDKINKYTFDKIGAPTIPKQK